MQFRSAMKENKGAHPDVLPVQGNKSSQEIIAHNLSLTNFFWLQKEALSTSRMQQAYQIVTSPHSTFHFIGNLRHVIGLKQRRQVFQDHTSLPGFPCQVYRFTCLQGQTCFGQFPSFGKTFVRVLPGPFFDFDRGIMHPLLCLAKHMVESANMIYKFKGQTH